MSVGRQPLVALWRLTRAIRALNSYLKVQSISRVILRVWSQEEFAYLYFWKQGPANWGNHTDNIVNLLYIHPACTSHVRRGRLHDNRISSDVNVTDAIWTGHMHTSVYQEKVSHYSLRSFGEIILLSELHWAWLQSSKITFAFKYTLRKFLDKSG